MTPCVTHSTSPAPAMETATSGDLELGTGVIADVYRQLTFTGYSLGERQCVCVGNTIRMFEIKLSFDKIPSI